MFSQPYEQVISLSVHVCVWGGGGVGISQSQKPENMRVVMEIVMEMPYGF